MMAKLSAGNIADVYRSFGLGVSWSPPRCAAGPLPRMSPFLFGAWCRGGQH